MAGTRKSEKKPPKIEPPDDLRFRRTGGYTWWCKHGDSRPALLRGPFYLPSQEQQHKPKPPSTSCASASAQRDIAKKNLKRLRERDEDETPVQEKVKHKKKLKLEIPKEEEVDLLLLDNMKARSREKIKQMLMLMDEPFEIDDEKPIKTMKTKTSSSSSKFNSAKPRASVSESRMCHQCQKSDRTIACCRNCGKRFCVPCIRRWYRFKLFAF